MLGRLRSDGTLAYDELKSVTIYISSFLESPYAKRNCGRVPRSEGWYCHCADRFYPLLAWVEDIVHQTVAQSSPCPRGRRRGYDFSCSGSCSSRKTISLHQTTRSTGKKVKRRRPRGHSSICLVYVC